MTNLPANRLTAHRRWFASIIFKSGALGLLMMVRSFAAEPVPKSNGWQVPAETYLNSISPDGNHGFFTRQSGTTGIHVIYDLTEGTPVLESWDDAIKSTSSGQLSFKWGPNHTFAYWDGAVMKIYSLTNKAQRASLPVGYQPPSGDAWAPLQVDFTHDSQRLVMTRKNQSGYTLETWDITKEQNVIAFDVSDTRPSRFVVSSDDKEIFQLGRIGRDNVLSRRSLVSGEVLQAGVLPTDWFLIFPEMQLAPGGKHLALYGQGVVKILKTADLTLQSSIGAEQGLTNRFGGVFELVFNAEGTKVITASWGLPVWNVADGKLDGILAQPSYHGDRILLSPGGEWVGAFARHPDFTLKWFKLTELNPGQGLLQLASAKASGAPASAALLPLSAESVAATRPVTASVLPPPSKAPAKTIAKASGKTTTSAPVKNTASALAKMAASVPASPLVTPVPEDATKEAEKAFAAGHKYYLWNEHNVVHDGSSGGGFSVSAITLKVLAAPGTKTHSYRTAATFITATGGARSKSGKMQTTSTGPHDDLSPSVTFILGALHQNLRGRGVVELSLIEPKGDFEKAKKLSNPVLVEVDFK